MSVAKRQLKTLEELREWIERHSGTAEVPEGEDTPSYSIVRRPPMTGAADWNVVAEPDGDPQSWSAARRHAIRTARLLFDVK
jgi:hypothetical protein